MRRDKDHLTYKHAERNDYIDFLRGIASIGIIAIHTAFWSGQSYTPPWFWNLTLFLDVPFFFFLSGWGSSYGRHNLRKSLKSLGLIWSKWVVFITVLALAFWILSCSHVLYDNAGVTSVRDFVDNCFFHVSFSVVPVVAGSIWFMPVYFVIILFTTLCISIIGEERFKNETNVYLYAVIALFVWMYYGNSFLGLDISEVLFYSAFWIIGFDISSKNIGKPNGLRKTNQFLRNIGIIIIGILITNYLQQLTLYDIQSAKFPPSPKYGLVSLVSIEVAIFFDGRINSESVTYKSFVHIGRNALYYFFGQGIGSSIIYYYAKAFVTKYWFFKWIGGFIINTIITIMIAELISVIYKTLQNCVYVIIKRTRPATCK